MPSVLITGASRGFGRALFEEYRKRGWTLFPLVRGRDAAEELEALSHCHPIVADVGTPEVEAQIGSVLQRHCEALDLLVNNAGHVKKLRWLPATDAADLEGLFRVHCVGALRCARAALPFLRKAPAPAVVNVTSRFGSIARMAAGDFRGIYSYSIAKSALNMLTACLDAELRQEGIRVFAVHPGRLQTGAAAADADTDPSVAAERFAGWVAETGRNAPCGLYDLMAGGLIPW